MAVKKNTALKMSCAEVIALLSDYMDGDLTPAKARDLEKHLALCAPCKDFLASLDNTKSATRRQRAEVPEACIESLRTRLSGRRGNGGKGGKDG